jgi:rhamnosyltransferase subunit B
MRVILTPVGSAGDVNPFIIVGRELRRRGHRVTLVAPDVFGTVAAAAGLEFVMVGSAEDYERATNNPDLWDPRRGAAVALREVVRHLRPAYAAIERVYEPNETLIVGHVLSFFSRVFEETHRVAAATMHLAPSVFRSDFRQPVVPTGFDMSAWPRWAKRAMWWAVDRFAIDRLVAPPLNAWRAEFGLRPASRIFKSWIHSPQRLLGLFPEWFGDPQPDWPSQLRLTGFVLSDENCAPETAYSALTAELDEFIAAGSPPVVWTPGTANKHASRFFEVAIAASAALGRRALLVTRYREQLPASLPLHVRHVPYAAFDRLFPRAAAVAHHGGIGTCAQALAAGVPQLIMPMGFDQPDNAARLVRLGVGEAIAPPLFTVDRVQTALGRMLSRDSVAAASRRLRGDINAANGVRNACDLLEEHHDAFTRRPEGIR